jgi:hypothetical protein
MRANQLSAAMLACVGIAACAHHVSAGVTTSSCAVDVLYFGRNIAGGGRSDSAIVSQREWRVFADSAFPRWVPGGSTEVDAVGRYLAGGRLVAESTKVVTIMHPIDPRVDAALDSLVGAYVRLFHQESVGRERTASSVVSCRG